MKQALSQTSTGRSIAGRSTTILVILLGVIAASPALATGLSQFTLMDGSVISGEIKSVDGGVYSVQSPSLGAIIIKDSEIRKIEMSNEVSATESAPSTTGSPDKNQLEAVQRRILGDDSILNAASALQADPQFQDILNDPSVMEALRAGNIDVLQRNPKVLRLLDDPRMKEINKKVLQ